MSFRDVINQLDWDQERDAIYRVTEADVKRALAKPRCNLDDFRALISPAAEPYLEQIAARSMQLTRQRFGNTIQFYVPLYLSNMCSNICTYCGFSMGNKIRRKTLDMDELMTEVKAIKAMGFDHILLVTGESPRKVGMDYFREALALLRPHFSHISMEVQPMDADEYAELATLGLEAVLVYQETYHRPTYEAVHLKGSKSNYDYRLETADRLGQAGIHKVGLGALLGLSEDWRSDSMMVARHLDYLQKQYWKTKYSLSFPRLRPCEGNEVQQSVINDRQLVQLICAYRLFNPDVELSLSTRESAFFRDNILPLGITTMSAASSTQPGGYAEPEQTELKQFDIDDNRPAAEVAEAVKAGGMEVVWKDWDRSLS